MALDLSVSTTNSSDSEPLNKSPAFARANVFARLQSLFPTAPSNAATSQSSTFAEPSSQRASLLPKFLKVKITTWNMHESLPKGDLVELLGEVTPVNPMAVDHPPLTSIPQLSPDANHPYHMIVVAGQECPSQSGLPLGLGAGFKLIDKDKEKDRESSLELEPIPPYGWTAILEDWYCHAGSAHVIDRKRGFRNVPHIPGTSIPSMRSTPNLKRKSMSKAQQERKGPYEILIKERMMGLYLAVFIHRDIKHLVRGTSKSSVTTGLIGGRVGNKGGVGISINLDGTTLLFVNAHLAAHEGKVMHRLHDLQKIKNGLAVEDYLHQDDPRVMKEDLTDKFDYSFIFGDLNFRLDVSRLHADWLISRRDYAQALAFDQLRNIMQTQEAFVGFNEAPINFPPTFKYDVLRSNKRRRIKLVRTGKDNHLNDASLIEAEEKDREIDDEDGEGDEGEAASMASSAFTSVHSRVTTDQDADDDDDESSLMRSKASRASTGNLINKDWAAFAAHKAKMKFAALLSQRKGSPSPGPSPIVWATKRRRSSSDDASPPSVSKTAPSTPSLNPDASSMKSSLPNEMLGPSLARSGATTTAITLTEEEDRGVYDTSAKQRVPSWCDRILWKSTVEPEPEPEEYETTDFTTSRARTRVGQFIAQAFRKRSRKSSYGSVVDVSSPPPPPPPKDEILTQSPLMKDEKQLLRITQPASILRRPNSIDSVPRPPVEHSLTRSATDGKSKRRRSTSLALPRSRTLPVAIEATQTPAPAPVPLPLSPVTDSMSPPLLLKDIRHVPSKWRLSFLPFFNRSQSTLPQDKVPAPDSPIMQVKPKPRRGDVVCLSYDTLDDRGMRRLQGRSDHRPVIGNFALYL